MKLSNKAGNTRRQIVMTATRPNIQKILATTDFSGESRAGVRYAVALAEKLRATVFHGANDIAIVPRPHAGFGEAVIRVTLTTICGTDLHIVRREYPVKPGLVIGHEPVGVRTIIICRERSPS